MNKENLPKLTAIYLYFSGYCNLNCKHCWINPDFKNFDKPTSTGEVEIKYIFRALKEAKSIGLKSVKLTGGEPFIRSDIIELLFWLKENNLKITIETNGTLIGEKEAKAIKEAGVSHISISLDGPDKKTHEKLRKVKGSFERALDAIKLIRKYNSKVHIQIICCIWKGNMKKAKKMVYFAKEIGANSIKFNPIQSISRADYMRKNEETMTVKETIDLYKKIRKIKLNDKFRVIFDIPMAFYPLHDLDKVSTCGIKNILGILSDGTMSICGIGSVVDELNFGNIKTDSLVDVWEKNNVLKIIREKVPDALEEICGMCLFKRVCLGKCRAEAYWDRASLLAPFSFCQTAYEQGLFPKNRINEKLKFGCEES